MFYPKPKTILKVILFIIYINILYHIQNIQPDIVGKENMEFHSLNVTKFDIKSAIIRVINEAKNLVKWELRRYNWRASRSRLEDLLPENGGKPLKILIISPWRSGSTYLGHLLSSLPGVLYYYEPLLHFNNQLIEINLRNDKETTKNLLKNLIKCQHFNLSYFKHTENPKKTDKNETKDHWKFYYYDNRMWWYCKENLELCEDTSLREKFCNIFPFHVVKDVHVRLPSVEDLLGDENLNLRIVVLARDPRAIVHSRYVSQGGCKQPPCVRAQPICEDLVTDYGAARRLLQKYPRKIKVLRFEDLALNPGSTARDLLQFLDFHMLDAAEEFLLTQNALSNHTGWVSRYNAFDWKNHMDFHFVEEMQNTAVCKEAMDDWGYIPAYNWTHQHSDHFLPISEDDWW